MTLRRKDFLKNGISLNNPRGCHIAKLNLTKVQGFNTPEL